MGQFNFVIIAGLCSGLMACATAQENPNYQYSSKYKGAQTQTQMADQTWSNQSPTVLQTTSQTAPLTGNTSRIYDGRPQGIILATSDHQAESYQPHSEHVTYSNTADVTSYTVSAEPVVEHRLVTSPTDQAYEGHSMQGTPGHGAYIPESSTPESSNYPESVDYDYSQNIVSANSNIANSPLYQRTQRTQVTPDSAPRLMVGNYVVKQGDTVYNLSRRLCVNLSDITAQNGLGQDYAIKIGQSLNLPASRC